MERSYYKQLQKQTHFHGKELHCNISSYTKINTFIVKELHCKSSYKKTNTFMERSCTVNLVTQKQTLSWKGVAL